MSDEITITITASRKDLKDVVEQYSHYDKGAIVRVARSIAKCLPDYFELTVSPGDLFLNRREGTVWFAMKSPSFGYSILLVNFSNGEEYLTNSLNSLDWEFWYQTKGNNV